MSGFNFNPTLSQLEVSSSLIFDQFGATGSLFGTASWSNKTKLSATIDTSSMYHVAYDPSDKNLYYQIPSFTSKGYNNTVRRIGVLDDGTTIVLGDFTQYGTETINYINALDLSGNNSTASFNFGTGFDSANVTGLLTIDSKNRVLMAPRYVTNYSGSTKPANTPFRVLSDGTVDPSWNLYTYSPVGSSDPSITNGQETPDGGYVFSNIAEGSYGGTGVERVWKTDENGDLDTTFNSQMVLRNNEGYISTNTDIRTLPDGKVAIFTTHPSNDYVGNKNFFVVNPDGTLDYSVTLTGHVRWVIVEPGTTSTNYKMLILGFGSGLGEHLTVWNGTALSGNILRINADGTIDNSFTQIATNNYAYAGIFDENEGLYFVGGNFTTANGSPSERIVSFDTTGAINTNFVRPAAGFFDNSVGTIVKSPLGNSIICGGSFTTYGGQSALSLIRLSYNGSLG